MKQENIFFFFVKWKEYFCPRFTAKSRCLVANIFNSAYYFEQLFMHLLGWNTNMFSSGTCLFYPAKKNLFPLFSHCCTVWKRFQNGNPEGQAPSSCTRWMGVSEKRGIAKDQRLIRNHKSGPFISCSSQVSLDTNHSSVSTALHSYELLFQLP